ncbi:MAG: 3-hydroxyacyl-CoA dehydrogenase/enoyl-CoA hydratase family protein, partial [Thermoplasmata archaeon]
IKKMKNVVVVGAGTMGHSIAEISAQAGYAVSIIDVNDALLEKAKSKIKWSLDKLAEKNRLREPVKTIFERIKYSTDLKEAAKTADLVIEAVSEDEKLKKSIFQLLDNTVPEHCIMATNTSSIPISYLAEGLSKNKNVIGLHFFNPPSLIKLVELIVIDKTDIKTITTAEKFIDTLNMSYIKVEKDVPGFVVNRLNIRIFLQALRLVEQGYSPESIDIVAKQRLDFPMGLLELIDFIGLDVLNRVIIELKAHGFDIEESSILKTKVSENKLGMKTGEGFYKYGKNYERIEFSEIDIFRVDPLMLIAPAINEAAWLIANKVADSAVIDKGMKIGMNFPKGLLEYSDEYGLDLVLETLKKLGVKPEQLLENMIKENKLGMSTGEGFYRWNYKKRAYKTIIYEKRSSYALITFNRPQKLNALTKDTWLELKEALIEADSDSDVKSILLTGSGKAFCTGDDIAVMASWKDKSDASEFFDQADTFTEQVLKTSKPIIGLVNGFAYGGGFEILLLFDMVFIAENAKLSLPELKIGAIPPIAATYGVIKYRKELIKHIFTADVISVKTAKEIGIADEIVPNEQLLEAGIETALKISKMPLSAIKAAKKLVNIDKQSYRKTLKAGLDELIEIADTDDFKTGMTRFLEKKR